jgi:hypothetical protein
MRYRQVYNQDKEKYELIPIDESARKAEGHAITGFFEPFQSPIDGSIIRDAKQLREHNRRHNVVSSAEFSPEHYESKRKEREHVSTEEKFKRKQELWEVWNRVEAGHRPKY